MSYTRVIPRDLFNEANLLKCFGKLFCNLEKVNSKFSLEFDDSSEERFDVQQYIDDGSLYIRNIHLQDKDGNRVKLFRPLNSRLQYPLVAVNSSNEDVFVFDEDGNFTEEFMKIIS